MTLMTFKANVYYNWIKANGSINSRLMANDSGTIIVISDGRSASTLNTKPNQINLNGFLILAKLFSINNHLGKMESN